MTKTILLARFSTRNATEILAASFSRAAVCRRAMRAIRQELQTLRDEVPESGAGQQAAQVLSLLHSGQPEQAYDAYRQAKLDLHVTPVLIDSAPYLPARHRPGD